MKIEAELQNALRLNSKDKVNYVFEKIYNDYFKLGSKNAFILKYAYSCV